MCAKWFEIKLWKKLIILFSITFIIIFVTLFETTPVNLNASNISEIYIGMHSMMVDDEDYKELAELCDKYGECQIN